MAFVTATLQEALLACFQEMTDGDNRKFSTEISNAFLDFVQSGKPQTTDAGAIPTGTFTGASTDGSLSTTSADCENIIYSACTDMNGDSYRQGGGNNYLAEKLAEGLQKMLDDTEVNTDVSGLTVPPVPPPPTIPTSGKAKGVFQCSTASVEAGLKECFSSMFNMTTGGNEYFATVLASLVDECCKSGIVNTDGIGNLAGSKGTGIAL